MTSQYSEDGKYFAYLSTDGKLKIWDTTTSTFEQEFTPNYHLTSPCTCLHFYHGPKKKSPSRKKMKSANRQLSSENIILGTTSGLLFIYSITKGDLESEINSGTNQSITCLSCNEGEVYSGAENTILCWDVFTKSVTKKWNGGTENITAILTLGDDKLLTASRKIKLWDVGSKNILKTFTGHSCEVTVLSSVGNNQSYFISGSKGDRLLNCYKLNHGKEPVANFLMEDVVGSVSVFDDDNVVNVAAVTRNGVVHVYNHTLNGKCSKPIKPKTTVQIASDSENSMIDLIPIVAAAFRDAATLLITYGEYVFLKSEYVVLNDYEKVQCLIRTPPKTVAKSKETTKSKIRQPVSGDDVAYVTPQTVQVAVKRKENGHVELPMEKRLENLTINKPDGGKVPKSDNVAQLLMQSLHSRDKNMLKCVLNKKDEKIVKNTIKRLPMQVVVPLINQLSGFIQGKTLSGEVGLVWLKNLVKIHSGLLLSNPELPELLGPILGNIESRLALQLPLCKLSGRLELLVSQVTADVTQEDECEALLVYNDKALSESDLEDIQMPNQSDSDNEWAEVDEEEEESHQSESNDGSSDDDVEMT